MQEGRHDTGFPKSVATSLPTLPGAHRDQWLPMLPTRAHGPNADKVVGR
jgi:hypothetical protein